MGINWKIRHLARLEQVCGWCGDSGFKNETQRVINMYKECVKTVPVALMSIKKGTKAKFQQNQRL